MRLANFLTHSPSVGYAATFVKQGAQFYELVHIAYAGTAKEEGKDPYPCKSVLSVAKGS